MKIIYVSPIEFLRKVIKKVGREKVNKAILKNPWNPHKALMGLLSVLFIIVRI